MIKEMLPKLLPNFPLFVPDIASAAATYRNFIMWQIILPLLLHHMISGENGFAYRISFLLKIFFRNFGSKLFLISYYK